MSKMWIIIKNEYAQVVKKKSFLIGLILTPVFIFLVTAVPAMLATKKQATTDSVAIVNLDERPIGETFAEKIRTYKLDDGSPAYRITNIYRLDATDSNALVNLRNELDSLIRAKELKHYVIFGKDPEISDSVILVGRSFSFRTSNRFDNTASNILSTIRLNKSKVDVNVDSVLSLTRDIELYQQAPGGKERDFLTMYLGGIMMVMIIFFSVLGYGMVLMKSIIEEKNSRIIEVLVSSVSPFQLLSGKIVGLGLANFTQLGIWILLGFGIYSMKGDLGISADLSSFVFNPIFVIYFVIFFILGYALFSTMFGMIGSIVNSDKEAQGLITPLNLSLIMPVILAMYFMQEPDSTITTVLSLIPIFTPTLMIMRMIVIGAETFTFSNPIIFEATLGIVIMAVSTIGVIWITAKIFRTGILMYGKRPTLPEIMKWVRYR